VVAFIPDTFDVPRRLETDAFVLVPLGPEHNESDHQAWMSSIAHIWATPGFPYGEWPTEMTLEANLRDLEEHAADFENREGFTFTVLENEVDVIGCVYIYPADGDLAAHVRSWVCASHAHLDQTLQIAVSEWLRSAWPFVSLTYAAR